ncbi:T9SS type A sorting domain-containing protein [candidate division GN15 bacterium]|nr:T9SS type A sorting domain-containing protein [candidate division GN15 bacterium]
MQPVWDDLSGQPLSILIDGDQDGIFEDTTIADVATDADDEQGSTLPEGFELGQNYPNPFNPTTTIDYSLPQRSEVRIEIINILGRRVKTLVNEEQAAGEYTVTWDGRDESGGAVATGVYFYRLVADDHVATKKMLLLK